MVTVPPDALTVECVPNFSEGRDSSVLASIWNAVAEVTGVLMLDRHVDPVHNRSVLTFVGPPGAVAEAAFRSAAVAVRLIDMQQHRGVHPRIGAIDVVPFVPVGSTPMPVCVDLAVRVGRRIAAELGIPVYLYGDAARRPERKRLPTVREGEYEGLRARIGTDPDREPDFGPPRMGAAGACAVGARPFLIAYNVTLATGDMAIARAIARTIRESSGGLPAVQAHAFPTASPNTSQVSMNLLDTRQTPLHLAFERIAAEAASFEVDVVESELVGLVPAAAAADTLAHYLRIKGLQPTSILEARLLGSFLARPDSTPDAS